MLSDQFMNHAFLTHPPRIAVVGTTGSGKTTLAKQIAQNLAISHIELDALHWEPNWTEVPDEIFRGRVATAIAPVSWVTDGNYSVVRDLLWPRANTIVWLDYSFPVTFGRLLRRTIHRAITQEPVCNGNRESLWLSFCSTDSILLWLLRTYGKNRQKYPLLFQQPEYAHLKVVRLRSPQATEYWLESLSIQGKGMMGE
ncbi:MAG: AAA family ATPase [Leptolyngbyaceae cyanobacterium]